MARKTTNIAASVRARLQNIAKTKQANFQRMLTRYALERLLFRLSVSPHKDRFVLKGAMLYAAWLEDPFRTTLDLGLLSFGEREAERLVGIFRDICVQTVEEDGLSFNAEHIAAEPIRDDQTYGGVRLRTSARLGTAVIPIQIDIGFGDAVTSGPTELEYPVLLDQPAPKLNAYPRETVAAEKFEAVGGARLGEQPHERLLRPPCDVAALHLRRRGPRGGHTRHIRKARDAGPTRTSALVDRRLLRRSTKVAAMAILPRPRAAADR